MNKNVISFIKKEFGINALGNMRFLILGLFLSYGLNVYYAEKNREKINELLSKLSELD